MPFAYRIVVEWSPEDEAYVARVPALSGCAAHGQSAAEAAREAQVAGEGILEAMADNRRGIPPPDAAPSYSGQLRLRLPRDLHRSLAQVAAANGVSLNQQLVTYLAMARGTRPARQKAGKAAGRTVVRKRAPARARRGAGSTRSPGRGKTVATG
jgi:antitoxin HicB